MFFNSFAHTLSFTIPPTLPITTPLIRYACQGASCWLGPVHCLGARWGGVAIPDQPGWNSGMPPPHTKPTRSPAACAIIPGPVGTLANSLDSLESEQEKFNHYNIHPFHTHYDQPPRPALSHTSWKTNALESQKLFNLNYCSKCSYQAFSRETPVSILSPGLLNVWFVCAQISPCF